MEASKERVFPIGRPGAAQSDEQVAADIVAKTNRDMGRVALFVSILAVILLTVFFFGLNQNMTGLSEQVKEIGQVKQQLAGVQQQMAVLEKLPETTRKMVLSGMLAESAQKLAYVQGQLPEGETTAKLVQALELLAAAQVDLAK